MGQDTQMDRQLKGIHDAASLKVLVADDQMFIRRIVREVLKSAGLGPVVEAIDGKEALLHLGVVIGKQVYRPDELSLGATHTSTVDCLITDFNMPVVTGLHLLRAVRSGETGAPRDLPVIVLTGFNDEPLLAAALHLDVSSFVIKPVSKAVLIRHIAGGLKNHIDLKPAETYKAVPIPDLGIEPPKARTELRAVTARSLHHGHDDEPSMEPATSLESVQAGSVLVENLHGKSGQTILSTGTILTDSMIRRLREIKEITGVTAVRARPPEDA